MSHGAVEAGSGTDPVAGPEAVSETDMAAGQDQAGSGEAETAEPEAVDEDLTSQLAHWKDVAKKNEQRAKENTKAAAELKKIQDSQKTELQLAEERAAEAERQRDEALTTHHQIMAAATFDIPTDLIEFLGTGTEDEISDRAEVLSTSIQAAATRLAQQVVEGYGLEFPGSGSGRNGQPTAAGAAAVVRRPVESLMSGTSPSGSQPLTNDGWLRAMARGEIQ